MVSANDLFCPICGKQQQKTPHQFSELVEGGQEVLATCPHCSSGVTKDQMYCTVCGNPIMVGTDVDKGDE